MDAEFWLDRWREGRTSFHMGRVMPLLQKHWPTLGLAAGSRVLVPLCGKSLDMAWLAGQGYQVLGVELSQIAVDAFFEENGLRPTTHTSALGTHHVAGDVEIIRGDIFHLDAPTLASCAGVYDRAAMVALPREMRERYAQHVYRQLADGYRGLLITLDYPRQEMDGPPFAVSDEEVHRLLDHHAVVTQLDRRDILGEEPRFSEAGVSRFETAVYQLSGKDRG